MNRHTTKRLILVPLLIVVTSCSLSTGSVQQPAQWHDTSPHKVLFITVDDGVSLEVLDWGGAGRPVVLLAGAGCTAHIYDGFAETLTPAYHVYGLTRRGFGSSSRPQAGYSQQHRVEDIYRVIDSLKLAQPVLVAHSMAGGEITAFAGRYPDRVGGLVYLDAARDPTRDMSSIGKKLGSAHLHPFSQRDEPTDHTFKGYMDWQMARNGFSFPESELRNIYETNADGTMGQPRSDGRYFAAIGGAPKPDYSLVHVPVLAIFALPARPAQMILRTYEFNDTDERGPVEEAYGELLGYIKEDEEAIKQAVGKLKITELRGSDHYVFLASRDDVLREMRAFLSSLKAAAAREAKMN